MADKPADDSAPPGDGDAVPQPSTDIPATRQHVQPPPESSDPLVAEHQLETGVPLTYPDDGAFAANLRTVDGYIGIGEQIVLCALMAMIVLTGAIVPLADKIADIHLGHKDEIMRSGMFSLALIGAAFASHQQRHLSMDLVSRRISPTARLVLRVVIALVVVFIVALFVWAGYQNHVVKAELDANRHNADELISDGTLSWMIPIGGVLIIFHTLVHAAIDVDYLLRGKLPPERARSGH